MQCPVVVFPIEEKMVRKERCLIWVVRIEDLRKDCGLTERNLYLVELNRNRASVFQVIDDFCVPIRNTEMFYFSLFVKLFESSMDFLIVPKDIGAMK